MAYLMTQSGIPKEASSRAPRGVGRSGLLKLLLLAIWFGLVGGLAEVVSVQLALHYGVQVRLSGDFAWMAPVANILYALAGLACVVMVGVVRRTGTRAAVAVGVFAGLLCATVGYDLEGLHRGAVLLLAAGVGIQAYRFADHPRARRFYVFVPSTAAIMAFVVGYWGIGWRVGEARRESAAVAALPGTPPGALNVLLLILDTVREQSTGLGDSTLATTPALDAFARRAVTFQQAIAPAPWTLPSHASFFTGRLPIELTADFGIPLDTKYPTLAEYLAARGYVTAGFVGNLLFATRASGLGRGFIHYDDFPVDFGQVILSSGIGRAVAGATWLRRIIGNHELLNRRHAANVTAAFLDWQARSAGRPFFAYVNLFDAHEPYFPKGRSGSVLAPGPKWTRYEHEDGLHTGSSAWITEKWTLTPDQVAIHAGAYQRAVSLADREVGRLLAELERRGLLEHTLVIIAADHGEQVGEHRLFEHINSLYLPSLHVPLVIASPSLPRGIRVSETVSLRDLPATVVDLLGLAKDSPFPGRSLATRLTAPGIGDTAFSLLRQGTVRQEWYPVGRGPAMFSLVAGDRHYIQNGDRSEELYDVRNDPGEVKNLVADPAEAERLLQLRTYLGRLRSQHAPGTTPARVP
jgi:arylsulfatase A-like enzyme